VAAVAGLPMQIPYSKEQGINSTEQGILAKEQGFFTRKTENIPRWGFDTYTASRTGVKDMNCKSRSDW
jgi:hypothetical protein